MMSKVLGLCSVGFAFCLVAFSAGNAKSDFLNVYGVGNSLTFDMRSTGGLEILSVQANVSKPINYDYHILCGQSLTAILNNPGDTCVPSSNFGQYSQAFATVKLDVVTLQPFYGNTIREEVQSAKAMVQQLRMNPLNLDTRILVFAAWNRQDDGDFLQVWNRTDLNVDSTFVPSAQAYDIFLSELRTTVPDAELLPVGHVFASIARQIQSNSTAVGEIDEVADLYRDNIHASNAGRYIASITALSQIYGQSMLGLGTSPNYATPNNGLILSEEGRSAVQQASWNVVQGLSAVPEPSPNLVLILACGVVFVGYMRTSRKSNSSN